MGRLTGYLTITRCALRAATLALAMALVSAGACFADEDHNEAKRLREAGDILPLEKIIEEAASVHPGKVIEAELKKKHGRYVYEIELLDDNGVVWELGYDARTGWFLGLKRDD